MCPVVPLQHQRWCQLIETFTVLRVFLCNRNFLGKENKENLQEPLFRLRTINQSSAKYWYWKASSDGCRFLCWDTMKDLARTEQLCQAIIPITDNCRGRWSQLFASCSLWANLISSSTPMDTYRLPTVGAVKQPSFFLGTTSTSVPLSCWEVALPPGCSVRLALSTYHRSLGLGNAFLTTQLTLSYGAEKASH